jgi:two-component system sensor histidine kinase TctE
VTASGSGLGLAIVRSVAERLGGAMRVDSGPEGSGCRITIELPLAAATDSANVGQR